MTQRKERQSKILALIAEEPISTQDELMARLRQQGCEVTQATISRDIKELKLVKQIGPGGKSVYSASQAVAENFHSSSSFLADCILSTDYALNTCVVKTRVGMANAACASIDSMNWDGMLGTIAGDDTIFVLCRTEEKAAGFVETLNTLIGS